MKTPATDIRPVEHQARLETRGRASLERRLPLMISGLLVVTIAAFGFFAFNEVRHSAIAAAGGQLRTIILQTGEAAGRTLVTRGNALVANTASPLLTRAIHPAATADDRAQALQFLRDRRTPGDSATFGSMILADVTGIHRLVEGMAPDGADQLMLDATLTEVRRRDSVTIGVPYTRNNAMWYWAATPLGTDPAARGYLAELRRIRANPNIDQQLKGFTGQDISMYYAAAGSDIWTGLGGVPIAAKFDVSKLPDTFRQKATTGESLIGVSSRIPGTSWFIVSTVPEEAITERAFAFLRRMLGVGTALLLIAIAGAWWVSRRVTQPLKSLTVAARQIARGDYAVRERIRTNDELGELALGFNRMAERIGESHALLGVRVNESEALARQLNRASQAKSEFLAMMSHELRTPLSAIAGYAEILQLGMRGQLNEAQQADLARIQANQVHLLRIINDILDLAQVESGQLHIATEPVALREVVRALEPIILPLFAAGTVRYSVDESVLPLVAMAERDRLTQVLVNLVANAARFTPSGSVTIHATSESGLLQLHVTDTGIGITADKHEAIFQPFVQADNGPSRRAQGTGLGLAISRRIVEAMSGTLTVRSAPNEGSTFTLSLVLVGVTTERAPSRDAQAMSAVPALREKAVL